MRIASLLLTAALAAPLAAAPAWSQAAPPPGDAASADPVYLEADTLLEDGEAEVYTAMGSVRLVSGDRIILADELIYDRAAGRITARGSVEVYEGSAPAQTADELVLDESLEEGVAYGFATLLENNGKAAAAAALRRPGGRIELRDAYYTACDLCEDGEREPSWRLRAREVVRDTEEDMIRYRDMTLEVAGVPVLYTPYFAHADPAANRKSGFLLPSVDISNRLGLSYQQPYFWAIGPYQDLVIAPRLMSGANPLVELEWVRRFYSGQVNVEASFTYEQEFRDPTPNDAIDDADWFGDEEFRGHVFADGRFQIAPGWSWGFGVQAAYDPLYLRRYDYSEQPEETSALFEFDQRTLISQLYVAGRRENYYVDLSTVGFARLDEDVNNDTQPLVAPLLRFSGDIPIPRGLGDLDIGVNAVNVTRQDGDDYARASLSADWSRPSILPGGVRAEAFALGRFDAYHFNETDVFGVTIDETTFTRALGAAGLDLSLPFLRTGELFDTVIGPRLLTVAATGVDDDDISLAAESRAFDLDRSTLFRPDRTGGYDVWEDGVRVDAGLEALIEGFGPYEAHFDAFVGRSFRLDGDDQLAAGPAVVQDESDWVAEVGAGVTFAEFNARTLIDTETGDLNRIDLNALVDVWRVGLAATYTEVADPVAPRAFEELRVAADFAVTDRINVFYDILRDIEAQENRRVRAGFQYLDECTDLRVYWEREETRIADLGPSEALKFEIVLFTLGGFAED